MNIEQVLKLLQKVHRNRKGWSARCPAHDDKRNSLSIGKGETEEALLKCHAGCSYKAIIAALEQNTSPLDTPRSAVRKTDFRPDDEATAVYDYRDERGELLYQV